MFDDRMKQRRAIRILLALLALCVLVTCGFWLVAHGIPPSKVESTGDRSNLEKGIGSSLSDRGIFQFHKGWTDTTSYYRLRTTDVEYDAILRSGNWEVASRDGTEGFGGRPLWWLPPVESPEWRYHKRQSPYGTGGFEVLIRHAGSKRTYFMTFTE
jgi:hypothetical protein